MSYQTYDFMIKEIKSKLNTKIIGRKFYHFDKIDSTNLYAKKLIKEKIQEGTIVISDVQTKGKGRKERSWSSTKGGLWFSIILYPEIPTKKAFFVTMTCSIAVVQTIFELTKLKSVLKWPNDILIKGKKVCGILTELESISGKIKYAIVGIGININNELDEEIKKTATSLYKETKTKISQKNFLISFLKNFETLYNKLSVFDSDYIKSSWLSYSNIIGKNVRIIDEVLSTIGKVIDIDDDGCIILETKNGKKIINFGDLEFL